MNPFILEIEKKFDEEFGMTSEGLFMELGIKSEEGIDMVKSLHNLDEIKSFLREALLDLEKRTVEDMLAKLGFMRQWLNEDRITDPKKMVSTEELAYWFKQDYNL